MGGDQVEKDKYSVGRVIGKHIPTNSLNVDWFKNWEDNENYQTYYEHNKKPMKEYYCHYEGKVDYHLLMKALDIPLFDSVEDIKENGIKCASSKCKTDLPIGIVNKCADKMCKGKLVEEDGKTKCDTCSKLIKRAKYYHCEKCGEGKQNYHKICATRKFDGDIKKEDTDSEALKKQLSKKEEEKK